MNHGDAAADNLAALVALVETLPSAPPSAPPSSSSRELARERERVAARKAHAHTAAVVLVDAFNRDYLDACDLARLVETRSGSALRAALYGCGAPVGAAAVLDTLRVGNGADGLTREDPAWAAFALAEAQRALGAWGRALGAAPGAGVVAEGLARRGHDVAHAVVAARAARVRVAARRATRDAEVVRARGATAREGDVARGLDALRLARVELSHALDACALGALVPGALALAGRSLTTAASSAGAALAVCDARLASEAADVLARVDGLALDVIGILLARAS